MKNTFFRTDTKALVGSVLLGIVFVIACQATGFLDNLLPTGKAGMYLINGTVWASFTALIVLLYKQPAGIIAGEVEAVISIWYSPLWIAFIFANAIGSLAVSFVAARCSMEKWWHHILAMFLCNVLGNICVGIGLVIIFGVPVKVAVVESLIVIAVCWPLSTIITKVVYDSIKKSGLVR
ncbi:hypothetical protein LPY66_08555 [Dehalobacter sp. DCM]|uniref:hypothetical protein n=1 Tax=Dehalobacter sp. DCM TaxID=2907827 RepID=UPI003081C0BA|nr:hypothetical protein LPY66_08555 [Dehalobacter sp. DCM]